MNSTITIHTTENPRTSSETSHSQCLHTVQQLQDSAHTPCLRLHLPLSCMTTPKCVLGVLSSGALGGTEMTGGLDGFLLEVVLFSVKEKKKKRRKEKLEIRLTRCKRQTRCKDKQVFRTISSTTSTWSSSGCWLWNLKLPPGFRRCSSFIRAGFRFLLDISAVLLSFVFAWISVRCSSVSTLTLF